MSTNNDHFNNPEITDFERSIQDKALHARLDSHDEIADAAKNLTDSTYPQQIRTKIQEAVKGASSSREGPAPSLATSDKPMQSKVMREGAEEEIPKDSARNIQIKSPEDERITGVNIDGNPSRGTDPK